MTKGPRLANGAFELAEAPSHLVRLVQQYYGDLFAREAGARDLTPSQFKVLVTVEQNEGVNQTKLVDLTGIDRSTLADLVRRMIDKDLLSRERTDLDQRANAVTLSPNGRRLLRGVRSAAERAERALLEPLPANERPRFVKYLAMIAEAGSQAPGDGEAKFRRRMRRKG